MIKKVFSHPPVITFFVLSLVFTFFVQVRPEMTGMATGGGSSSSSSTPVGFFDGQLSVNQGVANYSVPLEVPPGINGLQPVLSLNYTSSNSNGILGVGWSLGGAMSAITRCPASQRTTSSDGQVSARNTVKYDRTDRFCLDGRELVPVSGSSATYGSDNAVYQTYIDTGRRIVSKGTSPHGPDYFLVYEKNGLISRYGCAENGSCSTGAGGTHGLVGAPNSTRGMWAIVEKRTREGTKIEYEYRNTTVDISERLHRGVKFANASGPWPNNKLTNDATQTFEIERIKYAGNEIHFRYENRPDKSFTYHYGQSSFRNGYHAGGLGYALLSKTRLGSIAMTTDGGPAKSSYYIGYWGTLFGKTIVRNIKKCIGHSTGKCLPEITFDWTFEGDFPNNRELFEEKTFAETAANSPSSDFDGLKTNVITGDFNGDGKIDFIRQEKGEWDDDVNLSFNVYFSQGDGTFKRRTPPGWSYQDALRFDFGANIIPGDFDGDGKTDFIRQEKEGWADDTVASFAVYFATDTTEDTGLFDEKWPGTNNHDDPYQDYLREPPGVNIIPGDFNGDGRTDFIRQEKNVWGGKSGGHQGMQIYFANDQTRIDGTFTIRSPSGWFAKDGLRGSLNNIITGDFNGDGKTDFIRQEKGGWDDDVKGSVQIFFATDQTINDGSFHIVEPGRNQAGDPFQDWLRYDPGANIIPGDYNGDGKTDFIRQSRGVWTTWHSNNSFAVYFSKGNGEFEIVIPEDSSIGQYRMMEKEGDIEGGATLIPANLNGDSMTDFVYVQTGTWASDNNSNNILFFFSQGDGTFSHWSPVAGDAQFRFKSFYNGSGASVILADHNGDGYTDILRQEWGNWVDSANNNFSVWMNRMQPNVISGITENGIKTTLNYEFTTKENWASHHTQQNEGRFQPYFVVKNVHRPSLVEHRGLPCNPEYTHYNYGNMGVDPKGRGGLGFEWVESETCVVHGENSSTASTLKSKTWFSQSYRLSGMAIVSKESLVEAGTEKLLSTNSISYNGSYEVRTRHYCSSEYGNSNYSASLGAAIGACDADPNCGGVASKNCLTTDASQKCMYTLCNRASTSSFFRGNFVNGFALRKPDNGAEVRPGTVASITHESKYGPQYEHLGLAGYDTETSYTLDEFGYAVRTYTQDHGASKIESEVIREFKPVDVTDPNRPESYWLPGLETKMTERVKPQGDTWKTVDVRYTQYDESAPWRASRLQVPSPLTPSFDEPINLLGTNISYDQYGNVIRIVQGQAEVGSEASQPNIGGVRVRSQTYDDSGKYVNQFCSGEGSQKICRYVTRAQLSESSVMNVTETNTQGRSKTTRYEFDALGRKIRTTSPSGLVTSTQLISGSSDHSGGYLEQVTTGPDGSSKKVVWNHRGQKLRAVNYGFEGTKFYTDTKYDTSGRIIAQSLPYIANAAAERIFRHQAYDVFGKTTSYSTPTGVSGQAISTRQIHRPTSVVTEIAGGGNFTSKALTYDAFGRVIRSDNGSGAIVQTNYDGATGLVSEVSVSDGGNAANWAFRYDLLGNKTQLTDPATGVVEYKYNIFGDVIRQTQRGTSPGTEDDVEIEFAYDDLGRLVRREDAEGVTVWNFYDKSEALEVVTKRDSSLSNRGNSSEADWEVETRYEYDLYDRVTTETTKVKDTRGNSVDERIFVQRFQYDNKGRVTKHTLPNDFEVDYGFNAKGFLESVSTPRTLARENVRGFDEDHLALVKKLAEEHAAKLLSQAQEYSAKAQEYKSLSQHSSQRTNLVLNQRAHASSTGWGGDPSRAVDGNTDGNYSNGSVTHTHLAPTSWWWVHLPAGGQDVHSLKIHNRTDCCGHRLNSLVAYIYTPEWTFLKSMKLSEFTKQGAAYTAVINTANVGFVQLNVQNDYLSLAEVQVFEQWPHEKLNKTVDEMVRLAEQYLDWAEDASTAHEALQDQARALGQVVALADNQITYWYALGYDNAGQLLGFMHGNGLVTSQEYDLADRMTNITTSMGFKAPVRALSFSYDGYSNTTKRVDSVLSSTTDFLYDRMHRVQKVKKTKASGSPSETEYYYSSTGNITKVVNDDRVISNYGYNGPFSISSLSAPNRNYVLDSFGRVSEVNVNESTPDEELSLTWSIYGKPLLLKKGGRELRFSYDYNGNHIQKKSSDGSTTYYIGKDYEYTIDASGNVHTHKYFIYSGGELVAEHTVQEDSSQRILDDHIAYLHYDNLDNVDLVTDGHGKVLARYGFDVFGAREKEPAEIDKSEDYATNRSYTGHEWLDGFDLIHMGSRIYDPVSRRFLSPDNFVQDPNEPHTYNRYSYAWNNPMKYTDPTGDLFWAVIPFVAGAIIGGTAAGIASGGDVKQIAIGAAFGGLMGVASAGASTVIAAGGAVAFAKGMGIAVVSGIALQTAQDASMNAAQGKGYDLGDFRGSAMFGAIGGAGGTFFTSIKAGREGLKAAWKGLSVRQLRSLTAAGGGKILGRIGAPLRRRIAVSGARGFGHVKKGRLIRNNSRKIFKNFRRQRKVRNFKEPTDMRMHNQPELLHVRSAVARKGRWANLKSGAKRYSAKLNKYHGLEVTAESVKGFIGKRANTTFGDFGPPFIWEERLWTQNVVDFFKRPTKLYSDNRCNDYGFICE